MTVPPLLLIAEGRRARPRKPTIERPREIALHMAVAKLLRSYARSDWQWTHIASGELCDARTAGKLKQIGLRPGWPDFVLVPPHGQLHCLELKRGGETLSDEQQGFRGWCIQHGIPHVVAHSLDEVLGAFDVWNCLTHRIGGAT